MAKAGDGVVTPRGPLFRLLVRSAASVMRTIPRSRRAAFAFRLSRFLHPLLRPLPNMADSRRMHVEREEDIAFGLALRLLDRSDVRFDLRFDIAGQERLSAALRSGRGTLLVGTHALTTQLIMRALHDQGVPFHLVAGDNRYHIPGVDRWIETIPTSRGMLDGRARLDSLAPVRIRSALSNGELVWALLDRGAPEPGRTTRIETALGDVHVSDALFRIAVASGAQVLFMTSSMNDDGMVRVRYSAPPSGANASASELLSDYATAITEHNAALAARTG